MLTSSSALIIGATGATGQHLLRELLTSSQYERVGEYGRQVTPQEQLSDIPGFKDKLFQKAIDFDKLSEPDGELAREIRQERWDVVYITLGTTKERAGGKEAYEKVDKDYVINVARAAKTNEPGHDQRIVYCSALGADASSSIFYARTKGLTENGVAAVRYSDTIIFRPAYLANAKRDQVHWMEIVGKVISVFASPFSPSFAIDVGLLAKAMRVAGELGSKALPATAAASVVSTGLDPESPQFTLVGNAGALELSKIV